MGVAACPAQNDATYRYRRDKAMYALSLGRAVNQT